MNTALILIKPDAIQRRLVGNIYSVFEAEGYKVIAAKLIVVSKHLATKHYKPLKKCRYYKKAIASLSEKPVFAMVVAEPPRPLYLSDDIAYTRSLVGKTNPEVAGGLTIRGRYGRILSDGTYENVVHASEDVEAARREIKLWFPELTEVV